MARGTKSPQPPPMATTGRSPTGTRDRRQDTIMTIQETDTATAAASQDRDRAKGGQDTRTLTARPLHQKISPFYSRRSQSHYEEPRSDRESWWRSNIRETPNPGAYMLPTSMDELQKKKQTSSFKSDGRRLNPQRFVGMGQDLLPGSYDPPDLTKRLEKSKTSSSFKGPSRKLDMLPTGHKDKDVNLSPTAYKTEKYNSLGGERQFSRHWQFKSASLRFPTNFYKPKEGPSPGSYEYTAPALNKPTTSCFRSKTPRFRSSHTKVPAPGTYDRTIQYPMPKTIKTMGRKYGIFLTSAFES